MVPTKNQNVTTSPTSVVILSGYNRDNENKANQEGSDTNCEGIAGKTDID